METDLSKIQNIRPRFYSCVVPLAVQPPGIVPVGTMGRASITVNNFPFFFKRWRAAIVGYNQIAAPTPAAIDVFQDGQFSVLWYVDNDQFMNLPLLAAAFVDPTGRPGSVLEMLAPIPLEPKQSIQIEIMNLIPRAAGININWIAEGVEPR